MFVKVSPIFLHFCLDVIDLFLVEYGLEASPSGETLKPSRSSAKEPLERDIRPSIKT